MKRLVVNSFSIFILIISLNSCQTNVLYKPRPYPPEVLESFRKEKNRIELHYKISSGQQVAFYVAPKETPQKPPKKLWMLFGGIYSLVLELFDFFENAPASDIGFLYIELPGYGLGKGNTREELMLESTQAAFNKLAEHLKVDSNELEENLNLFGHSLGTARALQFAPKVKLKKLVLASPFTDMRELIYYRYGWFWGFFLNLVNPEDFDNVARLKEIVSRPDPPSIVIIHGEKDTVIPAYMGRKLSKLFSDITLYHEIPGLGHSGMFKNHLKVIYKYMFEKP